MNKTKIILIGILIICVTFTKGSAIGKDVTLPKKTDIAVKWIGFTADDLSFYRLELNLDGTGYCSVSYLDEPVELYEVKSWSLSEYKIKIELKPIDLGTEPIYFKGSTDGWHLDLELRGEKRDLYKTLKMYKEKEILSKINVTKDRINKETNNRKKGVRD